jgi:hypothetical protein
VLWKTGWGIVISELGGADMTNPFSEYVALLGDVEQIPVAARELPSFSSEQRAATVAWVVELVRDRALPQSDLEEAGRDALFDDRATPAGAPRVVRDTTDHEAILAPVDELADADPRDGAGFRNFFTASIRRSLAISVRLS